MSQNWLAVASALHVRQGKQAGFMQVCHGKLAPLRRIKADDFIIYYSPTVDFKGNDKLQAFTAIGKVTPEEPYHVDMGDGFYSYRRNVEWVPALDASMKPLIQQLDLSRNKKNWGYQLRFGLLKISEHDKRTIAEAMHAMIA